MTTTTTTTTQPRFHIIGAAGYVARKHMVAIQTVNGKLVTAVDPHDNVGILDSYNKQCQYYRDVEHWQVAADIQAGDYVVVCSPNDLHYAHAVRALNLECHAIVEKPLVKDPKQLERLTRLSISRPGQVYPVLQMRYHPTMDWLRMEGTTDRSKVKVDYVTPRGPWYSQSWKGDDLRSGGPLMNIGIHLFDMLAQAFGQAFVGGNIATMEWNKAEGTLYLPRADVEWRISLDPNDAPTGVPCRRFTANGVTADIERPPEDLHARLYSEVLTGRGLRLGTGGADAGLRLVWSLMDTWDG